MPTKNATGVTISKLVDSFPDMIRDSVQYSVITGSSIAENLLAATLKDIVNRSDQLYRYSDGNGYIHGSPQVTQFENNPPQDRIKELIAAEHGLTANGIELRSVMVRDDVPIDFIAKDYLKRTYKDTGPDYYIEPKKRYTGTREQLLQPGKYDILIANENNSPTTVEVLTTVDQAKPSDYYYVAYWLPVNHSYGANTNTFIWVYNPRTGSDSVLNGNLGLSQGTFYPVMPIRNDKVSLRDETDDTEFKSVKKALNLISVNIDELLDAIEENPDVDKIDDAFVMYGVDVYTEQAESIEYLYRFFDSLAPAYHTPRPTIDNGYGPYQPYHGLVFIEADMNMSIKFLNITKNTVTGKIGDLGSYKKTLDYVNSDIIMMHQVRENEYIEITMKTVSHSTYINPKNSLTGQRWHATRLSEDADERLGFLFPVNRILANEMATTERRVVLYDSLHIVIYAIDKIKLKWYQTGLFLSLVEVIGYGLAIFTAGNSLILAAAVSYTALLLAVVKLAAQNLLLDYVVQWIYEKLGDILGFIVILAAYAYGKGIDLSISNLLDFSADKLVDMVTAVSTTIDTYTSYGLQKVQEEYGELAKDYEEELKRLDEDIDALGLGDPNIPLYMAIQQSNPLTDFYESPEMYYERASHTANPGVATLDFATTYVDQSLSLPKLT